jgi:hypothetical protein
VPRESGAGTDTVLEEARDVNMNPPGLTPYARLIEEDATRRFGAYDDASLRDSFAHEEQLVLQTLATGVSVTERVVHQLYATVERQASVTPRLRVRWSHWKTDGDAMDREWSASRSIS